VGAIALFRKNKLYKDWEEMIKVTSIVYKPESAGSDPETHYVRLPLEAAELVAGHGIAGDRKGGNPKRNLNLMSFETLEALHEDGFDTLPGQMGEQIVIQELDMGTLAEGDRLQIGEQACVEVVNQRTGCGRFEQIQGRSRKLAAGRMGIMAKVLTGGKVVVGDAVKLLPRVALPENSVHPLTRAEWRAWLEQNQARMEGIWLVSYKKSTGKPRVEYKESVEEALCFGWIDSKGNKLDDERTMLWFAPRKSGSNWSASNKERVERLAAAGLMTPAGMAKIEAAKEDGSWNALDSVEALEVPPDLEAALRFYSEAKQNFEAFPRSVKRGILEWIVNAKRPETRAKRIEETARLAQDNIRANQWRQ
jgi:uncharacterized protein YdeI (YjbR/CyaY-like superfamily)